MIYTHLLDMKTTKVGACVAETEEGDFIVFINSRSSYEKRMKDYFHELRHIARSDFEKLSCEEAENVYQED